MKRATGNIRSGGKIMNKKLLRQEQQIQKEIATPGHKYLKIGHLSIHLDPRSICTCTEGQYHSPLVTPKRIRFMYNRRITLGLLGYSHTVCWVRCIDLTRDRGWVGERKELERWKNEQR